VLKEVAVIARKSARESDLVARYGGEEFAMVVPRGDQTMAARLRAFHEALTGHTFNNGTHTVSLTVSLGLATYPFDATWTES